MNDFERLTEIRHILRSTNYCEVDHDLFVETLDFFANGTNFEIEIFSDIYDFWIADYAQVFGENHEL